MKEIINIIMNDAELSKYIIKPFGQLPLGTGITYEFNCASSDGIKAQYRLSITSVSYSIDECMSMTRRIKQLLLSVGDESITNSILKVVQNGGGSMNNLVDGRNMYHFTSIFNVTIVEDKEIANERFFN